MSHFSMKKLNIRIRLQLNQIVMIFLNLLVEILNMSQFHHLLKKLKEMHLIVVSIYKMSNFFKILNFK